MDVPWAASRRYDAKSVTVLELHGDLVAGTVLKLQRDVAAALADSDHALVLDLQHVRTVDTTGATMLAAAAQAARPQASVRLAHPPPRIRAVLRTVGVLDAVAVFNTVAGAVRGDAADVLADQPPSW
ncbi:anti-anti-sigma factor [Actinoplanes octamycinicus]|uniref:Anti-anti-sigma factor n=1 Tax=Actinoplanes octamycinicus TaxID=135948 RepID=A0A7W7MBC1_9ACTN|nr:STAS domain-containing protein [Actinoplanes octamycinicus]MBB4743989.1 anti-anti-sigma factor [Actinoplanes octamycinicus]